MLGYHANCGGRVVLAVQQGVYTYQRCSSCRLTVCNGDLVQEPPPHFKHWKKPQKKRRKVRYDIKSWKDVDV
jgi:hypothetical protein